MTPKQGISFVRRHGVVLESARGPAPSLAEAIAGEPIVGSWWGHPRSHEIFEVTRAVRASEAILVCRLVDSKITFVHQRLWRALVAAADRLPKKGLALVQERHTSSGRHVAHEVPLPRWVPDHVVQSAAALSQSEALSQLPSFLVRT